MEKKLRVKYKSILKPFENGKDISFSELWMRLLRDLTNVSESVWDYNSIRYQTVMNRSEWKAFVSHSERKPYESKIDILPDDQNERLEFILQIIESSIEYLNSLSGDDMKKKLKVSIGMTLDCALNARYFVENIRMGDIYFGRSVDDRDDGKINPTEVSNSKLSYAIAEYCNCTGKDFKQVSKRIKRISRGRLDVLSEYYSTCDLDDDTRKEIRAIFYILRRDQTLLFADIKLGWQVWKLLRKYGIDVDLYLELIDLPHYAIVKEKLLEFQSSKKYVNEILKHMQDELPESYKVYKSRGWVYFHELRGEEASRKKYPKKLRTDKQISRMVKECYQEVYSYFPLGKKSSPSNILFNPIHPAATSRAFQSTTRSVSGNKVNAIVMTPRVLQKDDYLRVLAHETGHLVHRIILNLAEDYGLLKSGDAERVPMSVVEEFSQLVEHVFKTDHHLPYKKKFHGNEFPDFWSGIASRYQVPYALVQLGIRKDFENLWNEGFRGELSEQKIWDLKYKFDRLAHDWMTMNLNIYPENFNALNLFRGQDPDDGLVYMKRYINVQDSQDNKSKLKPKKLLKMGEAFRKRFGRDWIKSYQARVMLLWLMLESGRNYQAEKYSVYILEKSIDSCEDELKKLGVTSEDI